MANRFVLPNIGRSFIQYRNSLQFVIRNDDDIKRFIKDRVLSVRPGTSVIASLLSPRQAWLENLLMLDPVAYSNESKVTSKQLLSKHDGQVVFANKVLPIVGKLDFNSDVVVNRLVSNYGLFLDLCLQNRSVPIIPTLVEDFVWHSHMLDHTSYVLMTRNMFGRILEHRTDIDLKRAEKKSQVIREKYLKSKGIDVGAISSSSIGAMAVLGVTYAATSSLGTTQIAQPIQPTQKQNETRTDGSGCSTASCAGMNLTGFGPSGIYNPINPWNSVNPISPYYHSHHDTHSYDTSDSGDSGGSSSCSSGSCGSGGCGGD